MACGDRGLALSARSINKSILMPDPKFFDHDITKAELCQLVISNIIVAQILIKFNSKLFNTMLSRFVNSNTLYCQYKSLRVSYP